MTYKAQKQYRLPTYNYGRGGVYFLTICVQDKVPALGEVMDGKVCLSAIGEIVKKHWLEIPQHYPNSRLDQWVIMPDHLHGIIIIKPNDNDLLANQEDTTAAGLRPLRPASIPAIVNQFKGSVKRWCNQNGHADFAWQARYHDHIVRSREALHNIREYIIHNPENWVR